MAGESFKFKSYTTADFPKLGNYLCLAPDLHIASFTATDIRDRDEKGKT